MQHVIKLIISSLLCKYQTDKTSATTLFGLRDDPKERLIGGFRGIERKANKSESVV